MSNQPTHDQAEMTFGEHLDEVRKILVRVAIIFSILFVVLFMMKGIVLDVVFAPIRETFPTNRIFAWLSSLLGSEALHIHPENVELFNNKMAGQFLLHIKSSVVGAFIIAFPYLIWELWLFVKPALPPHQRKQSIRYVLETPIWFIMGLLFGYYIISPLAINFLGNYQVSEQISNIIDVSSFMTTVISVSFAAAIAFQLPLLIRLLATMGIVTSSGMRQYRRIAAAALLIFSAVITPPDVVSQVLIFFPCYALYEYGIGITEQIEKRRAKEEAAYQAQMAAEKAAAAAAAAAATAAESKAAEQKQVQSEENTSEQANEVAEESTVDQAEATTEAEESEDNTPEQTSGNEDAEQAAEEENAPEQVEPAEEAEQAQEAESPEEVTEEPTDEIENPGDYSVMEQHDVAYGVSDTTDEDMKLIERAKKMARRVDDDI